MQVSNIEDQCYCRFRTLRTNVIAGFEHTGAVGTNVIAGFEHPGAVGTNVIAGFEHPGAVGTNTIAGFEHPAAVGIRGLWRAFRAPGFRALGFRALGLHNIRILLRRLEDAPRKQRHFVTGAWVRKNTEASFCYGDLSTLKYNTAPFQEENSAILLRGLGCSRTQKLHFLSWT